MAAYATVAQATALYGLPYLTVACDRDGDGDLDSTEFEAQLDLASTEINGYLLGRYALPLTGPALDVLSKKCVDIAVYNSAATADVGNDLITARYEAAIKFLELVAQNRIKLELATDTAAASLTHSPSVATKSTIQIVPGSRQFRRDCLKRLM